MAPNKNTSQTITLADRTAERLAKENVWQEFSSKANFHPEDMTRSLQELAEKTFPTDEFNSKAYQEAIATALAETISPEIGVKDFWMNIGKAGCMKLAIIDGHLNFFDSKNEKMDITAYTRPIIFEAHSSFYKQRLLERQQHIKEARQQLDELIQEIHKSNKNK